ncbi:MAG: AAA family ATPase [Burkholderiales bacterium]
MSAPLPPLAVRLAQAGTFPHPATGVECVETHISWVVLAGEFAYKLKKPVDFGFLDFSTLAKRHAACVEEVRLNARLAPDLYLDVVPVTDGPGGPAIGGDGPPAEYAVRMHRFDRTQELDRLLRDGALPVARIDELARLTARFHAGVARATADDPWGSPATVLANARANFEHAAALEHAADVAARLDALLAWTEAEHARITPLLLQRKRDGSVREGHGDLHLANMVVHAGRVTVFDCIEFNPALRWNDVMSEIAFTVMDLAYRGRPDLAQRFANDYLEETGDYAGLAVLPWFLVYRAMVRAKIAAIRAAQADGATAAAEHRDFVAHLALAESYARPRPRALVITCGASGSGKSHLAGLLLGTGDWIRLRTDVERKRMAGLARLATSASGTGAGLYTGERSAQTYARLAALARDVLAAGWPVLLDGTFLRHAQRGAMRDLAAASGVPFAILWPDTPPAVMRERVTRRAAAGGDPSEATPEVLERQLAMLEPLAADELPRTVRVDAAADADTTALAQRVAAALAAP